MPGIRPREGRRQFSGTLERSNVWSTATTLSAPKEVRKGTCKNSRDPGRQRLVPLTLQRWFLCAPGPSPISMPCFHTYGRVILKVNSPSKGREGREFSLYCSSLPSQGPGLNECGRDKHPTTCREVLRRVLSLLCGFGKTTYPLWTSSI